ncbi:LD-carboxypeptidase [Bacteroidales bacterium]|nr:LD-carboxypeptidase [Bacteroidales bacterium]
MSELSIPSFLKKGDTVAIVAPAGSVKTENIEPAITILKQNYKTIKGKYLYTNNTGFSASDQQRLEDLNNAIQNPVIKAIFCARGGYGISRIIDHIDFESLQQKPKWIIGLSDITSLLHAVNQFSGLASMHALMPNSFCSSEKSKIGIEALLELLQGDSLQYYIEKNKHNKQGEASATITGGNLSVICSLLGTQYEIDTRDKILFIEDIAESLYKIDRMMNQLRLAGKLQHIKGLIVGQFTNCLPDQYYDSLAEMISPYIEHLDIPVCFDFKAGHIDNTAAFIFGQKIHFDLHKNGGFLNFNTSIF